MFGLIVILIALGYLLLSIAVVIAMRKHARNTGKNVRRWGWGAALAMWLIPFWDWLPTVAVHQYACATEAGFWVYKTPEQWKLENPGVMETLLDNSPNEFPNWPSERRKDGTLANINQRFALFNKDHLSTPSEREIFINVWRWQTELMDKKTGEILARRVEFSRGNDGYISGMHSLRFWLQSQSCMGGAEHAKAFGELLSKVRGARK